MIYYNKKTILYTKTKSNKIIGQIIFNHLLLLLLFLLLLFIYNNVMVLSKKTRNVSGISILKLRFIFFCKIQSRTYIPF